MPNNTPSGSRSLPGVFFAALFAVTGLAACSGGGGGGSTTSANTTNTTVTTYTITASAGAGGTVTPSGATTVAQGASQSYTITPGAGYAIATLVIDGTTVANSSTYTFANVQANHTISATFSAAAPGGIVLSLVPARTSGVAPLSVFFDASATTDTGVTTHPFHDLEYTWSFGDSTAGTWTNGAQPGVSSKNSATGPVAAHVFETPGTYTVTVTAFDGSNSATTNTTITVSDPNTVFAGTNTVCIGATTTPVAGAGGCPAGAQVFIQSNFATAINTYALAGRRLLFKRGDTFGVIGSTPANILVTGPGIVGAFGTNVSIKPIVQMTGGGTSGTMLVLSSRDTPGIKDWRIMDLQFEGMNQSGSRGISAWGGIDQLTILRTDIYNIEFGILLDGHVLDGHNTPVFSGHTLFDEIAIVDSTLTPIVGSIDTGGARLYLFAERLSVLGNTLGSTSDTTIGGSHVIRASIIQKGVIANNLIQRAGGTFLAIKMHAPGWCDVGSPAGICATPNWCTATNIAIYPDLCAGMSNTYKHATNVLPLGVGSVGYTEKVVVSDNKIIGYGGGYLVNIGPQNSIMDERVQDVIVERNWFKAGAQNTADGLATRSALVINSSKITARNNICDLTGGGNARYCVNVRLNGPATPAPPPDNVRIYNNTAYSGDAAGAYPQFAGVLIETGATNVTVQNNLAFAPLASASGMISNTCVPACSVTASHNSTDDQVKTVPPPFTATPPTLITDWVVTAGSYAVSGGTVVPVWSDFFRTSRPQNGVIDIGAVEGP